MTSDRTVTIPVEGGQNLAGYLAQPEGAGPWPGIVVIHEVFGLNENIREIARRFAAEGYAALAVDLFSTGNRIVCIIRVMYGAQFRSLENGTVKELTSTLDWLRGQPGVDGRRVGAIGFCMGGSYALQLACVDKAMRAASVFYGQNPKPLEAVAKACPIVGSYPGKDFTAQAARKLEPVLEKYQIPHDIKIYPGAKHSFFNDQGPAYDPAAAEDSWQRMMAFFEKYLKA